MATAVAGLVGQWVDVPNVALVLLIGVLVIIEALDGRITAANRRDGSGAVLTITLPLPAPRVAAIQPAASDDLADDVAGAPLLAPRPDPQPGQRSIFMLLS